jgi:hypothetical protein
MFLRCDSNLIHLRTTNPIESTFATVRHRHRKTKGSGTRAACRYIILIGGASGWAALLIGGRIESNVVIGLGCVLLTPVVIAIVILFFMGGLAPQRSRRELTKRERDLLDN